jgi:hypothetical protein
VQFAFGVTGARGLENLKMGLILHQRRLLEDRYFSWRLDVACALEKICPAPRSRVDLVRRAIPEARSAGGIVRRPAQHGPLDRRENEVERAGDAVPELDGAAEIEIVLAGLRGDRSVKEVCREHAISETLYYAWRSETARRPLS